MLRKYKGAFLNGFARDRNCVNNLGGENCIAGAMNIKAVYVLV